MRIIAGKYGGRQIESPKGHRTHPMGDRIRGGLFNALGDIVGLSVLDAFAGSGAISIEALSRGAKHVIAIDVDASAYKTLKNNTQALNIPPTQMKVIRAHCSGWSKHNPLAKFDIVVAAPPYDDLQEEAVEKLARHLEATGIFVLDWPGKIEPPRLKGLKQIAAKSYGDAQVVFYKHMV